MEWLLPGKALRKMYTELSVIYELAETYFEMGMTSLEIGDKKNAEE